MAAPLVVLMPHRASNIRAALRARVTGDSIAASPERLVTEERPIGGTKLARGPTVTITLGR
jgi:hypothetical protein